MFYNSTLTSVAISQPKVAKNSRNLAGIEAWKQKIPEKLHKVPSINTHTHTHTVLHLAGICVCMYINTQLSLVMSKKNNNKVVASTS